MTEQLQKAYKKRDDLIVSLQNSIDNSDGSYETIKAQVNQINDFIAMLEGLEDKDKQNLLNNLPTNNQDIKNGFKIIADAIKTGKFVNELGEGLKTGGLNGEDYLLPEDVKLEINKYKQELLSAKELVTVIPTFALSGTFNWGKNPTDGLIDFEDGGEVDSSKVPEFVQEKWAVKWKGAIIPISTILQGAEQAGLMPFINYWFTRRAVISENKDIFDAFKTNYKSGTPKALADEKALRKSINKDLDPIFTKSANMVVVTNQSGFDYLDSLEDGNNRPLLQPDPTQPTQKLYKGHPVKVYSNTQLPNIDSTHAPIIYGSTKDALWFIEYMNYYFDSDNGKGMGFTKNQTLLKVIEGYAISKGDVSAYVYGSLVIPEEA